MAPRKVTPLSKMTTAQQLRAEMASITHSGQLKMIRAGLSAGLRVRVAQAAIEALQTKLEHMRVAAGEKPDNWGFDGSAAHLANKLIELLEG